MTRKQYVISIYSQCIYDFPSSKMNRYSFYVRRSDFKVNFIFVHKVPSFNFSSFFLIHFAEEILGKPQYTFTCIRFKQYSASVCV